MVSEANTARAAWHPRRLLGAALLASALLGSWYWPMTRGLWDMLDTAAFHALHGPLLDASDTWRWFWAVTNTRAFSGLAALGFVLVFTVHVGLGGWRNLPRRLAEGLVIAAFSVVVVHFSKYVFGFERLSPSLVLEPVFRLSGYIEGARVKDASGNSFPGDHATAVMLFSMFIAAFTGWRLGLVAAALALVVMLPRLVAGAHWLSDLLVGSASLAMMAAALCLATPLAERSAALLSVPLGWLVRGAVGLGLLTDRAGHERPATDAASRAQGAAS